MKAFCQTEPEQATTQSRWGLSLTLLQRRGGCILLLWDSPSLGEGRQLSSVPPPTTTVLITIFVSPFKLCLEFSLPTSLQPNLSPPSRPNSRSSKYTQQRTSTQWHSPYHKPSSSCHNVHFFELIDGQLETKVLLFYFLVILSFLFLKQNKKQFYDLSASVMIYCSHSIGRTSLTFTAVASRHNAISTSQFPAHQPKPIFGFAVLWH